MAGSPIPFGITTQLSLPPASGLPVDQIPLNFAGQYLAKSNEEYNLTGSGTITVPMGSVGGGGALAVIIVQDVVSGAAPILVKYNGASQPKEISPGGFDVYCNPTPTAGITAMTFDYTAVGRVRVWIFG